MTTEKKSNIKKTNQLLTAPYTSNINISMSFRKTGNFGTSQSPKIQKGQGKSTASSDKYSLRHLISGRFLGFTKKD